MAGLPEPRRTWSEDDRLGWMRDIQARLRWGTFALNPGSIAANSTEDVTATSDDVAQLRTGHHVTVAPPSSLEAGLVAGGAWVATNGQITVRIANVTGSPIDPDSATWTFLGLLV